MIAAGRLHSWRLRSRAAGPRRRWRNPAPNHPGSLVPDPRATGSRARSAHGGAQRGLMAGLMDAAVTGSFGRWSPPALEEESTPLPRARCGSGSRPGPGSTRRGRPNNFTPRREGMEATSLESCSAGTTLAMWLALEGAVWRSTSPRDSAPRRSRSDRAPTPFGRWSERSRSV
jgi:hypothetical protein